MKYSTFEQLVGVETKLPGENSLFRKAFFFRFRWRLAIAACAFLSALFGLGAPFLQKFFIDRLAGTPGRLHFDFIDRVPTWTLIVAAFGCLVIAQGFNWATNFIGMRESSILQRLFAHKVFAKMLALRAENLTGRSTGEVVALYATDVQGSTAFLELSLPVGASVFFPLTLGPFLIHFLFGIPLTPMFLVMGVITLICAVLAFRQAGMFLRFKQLGAERAGFVNEWIQNIRTLRVLSWMEAFEEKIFRKREEETVNRVRMVTNGQVMSSIGSSASFFLNLVAVGALVAQTDRVPTPGEVLALLWILGIFLSRPFRQIPWVFTFSMDGLTSLRRVERFLALPSPKPSLREGLPLAESHAAALPVEVRNLSLILSGKPILHRVSFDLKPGELVAVVGEVGSGKTMLALSLLGETSATFDEFRIGREDALKLPLTARRSRFGFVPQDGFVASASLRDNVVFDYGTSHEHDAEVQRSLRLAQLNLEREALPQGLDTEIGERGVNLSGGQRQRVALARAHFYDRPILILDDSLSAVDVDTERKLLDDLIEGEWKNRTRLLITHRLSVLPTVDRIFFLEGGQLIAQGKFEDLLRSSDTFRSFVEVLSRQGTHS